MLVFLSWSTILKGIIEADCIARCVHRPQDFLFYCEFCRQNVELKSALVLRKFRRRMHSVYCIYV